MYHRKLPGLSCKVMEAEVGSLFIPAFLWQADMTALCQQLSHLRDNEMETDFTLSYVWKLGIRIPIIKMRWDKIR